MRFLPELFANNRAWVEGRTAEDPEFFDRLARGQRPAHLWIGCADSRVPPNEMVGLPPGDLFVHRNVANLLREDDPNGLAVLQYAVETLQVRHVIVCGHYGCGGVGAALGPPVDGPLETWLTPIRSLRRERADELDGLPDDDARWRRLCELNVRRQVETARRLPAVRRAWDQDRPLILHGWICDLRDGRLRDLGVSVDGSGDAVE